MSDRPDTDTTDEQVSESTPTESPVVLVMVLSNVQAGHPIPEIVEFGEQTYEGPYAAVLSMSSAQWVALGKPKSLEVRDA